MADQRYDLEQDVDVIEARDGDLRATIQAIIIANRFEQQELRETKAATYKEYRRFAS